MAKRSRQEKKNKPPKAKLSAQAQLDAQAITEQVCKPSFSKQQRKEVHQAIQQGIERYKQQHSAKARSVDKQRKKYAKQQVADKVAEPELMVPRRWPIVLPWLLLMLSWAGFFAAYAVQQ